MPRPERRARSLTYADAGVDIGAGHRAVELIRDKVRSTFRPEVLGDVGGFSGMFAFDPSRYAQPLLVSSTDGVGTKVMIAERMEIFDTIGVDLVAMSVNDVLTTGAEPLFFLDYIVTDKLVEGRVADIVAGIAEGCRQAGCALLGGEMAEHPGHMKEGTFDLAGFCVGVVDKDRVIDGKRVGAGDAVIGVGSSGLHSNGYSLARKVLLDEMGLQLEDEPIGLGCSLGEELLRPTLIYASVMRALTGEIDVHSVAHVTGGGISGNLARVIPDGLVASLNRSAWEKLPIFTLIQSLGQVSDEEMEATFNMGLGLILVVSEQDANKALDIVRTNGYRAYEIGSIQTSTRSGEKVRLA